MGSWDVKSHTGSLCQDSVTKPQEAGVDFPLSLPTFKARSNLEDYDRQIMSAFMAWQVMRLLFRNTRYLNSTRPQPLPEHHSRLDDDDMRSMMIEACSNMEVILERWETLD